MKQHDHTYFQNRDCAYFPCHKSDGDVFNCLFCYCPLYALGDRCGGNFAYTEGGVKDCSRCMLPHSEGGYAYILSKFGQISALASENRHPADPTTAPDSSKKA